MKKVDTQSYYHFMVVHLFSHVDIKPQNIYIPNGSLNNDQVNDHCLNYEKKIHELGGIDFQLLGIGRTGHIGFNEPGSNYNSLTRLVHLDYITRNDARKSFYGIENVPTTALTMGIETIRKSKSIEATQIQAAIALHSMGNLSSDIDLETRCNFEKLRKSMEDWKQLALAAISETKNPEKFLKI